MSPMKKSECLMEFYLFYSSLTLFAMGCLALVLSIFFHLKSRALNSLPKNLTANIFSKTFVVFDPYPERRNIFHGLSLTLPVILIFVSAWLALIVLKFVEYGFVLSLFMVIVSLNLIVLDGVFEVYQNSKTFIKAVQGGTDLGVGDLNAFQIVKNALPKIIKYYLGLSIFFIALSVALPYIWFSILWFFTQSVGLTLETSASAGVVSFQVAVFLFALALVVIQILALKIKNKLLNYIME
jgi:hypothetical protein